MKKLHFFLFFALAIVGILFAIGGLIAQPNNPLLPFDAGRLIAICVFILVVIFIERYKK